MAGTQFSRRILARVIAGKLAEEPARQEYWMRVLAGYLVDHRRVHEAELLIGDIERELLAQTGQLAAKVVTARPLDGDARATLIALLASQTGATKVALSEAIDPDVLGGMVVRTADAELDASVRSKLKQLATI